VAVVAAPDEKWGEVPVAFVTLKEGATVSDAELIEHVRQRLARFNAPKRVIFGPLPKTATGKVQRRRCATSCAPDDVATQLVATDAMRALFEARARIQRMLDVRAASKPALDGAPA
jgi:acyl-CoA synthetase (AMP-forming)/AMP-acid ligase II